MIFSKLGVLLLGAIAPLSAFAAPTANIESRAARCNVFLGKGCASGQICRIFPEDITRNSLRFPYTQGQCVDKSKPSDGNDKRDDIDVFPRQSQRGCNTANNEGCGKNEVCIVFSRFNSRTGRNKPVFYCAKDAAVKRQEEADVGDIAQIPPPRNRVGQTCSKSCNEGERCVRKLRRIAGSTSRFVFKSTCVAAPKDRRQEEDDAPALVEGEICNPQYEDACGGDLICSGGEEDPEPIIGVCLSKPEDNEDSTSTDQPQAQESKRALRRDLVLGPDRTRNGTRRSRYLSGAPRRAYGNGSSSKVLKDLGLRSVDSLNNTVPVDEDKSNVEGQQRAEPRSLSGFQRQHESNETNSSNQAKRQASNELLDSGRRGAGLAGRDEPTGISSSSEGSQEGDKKIPSEPQELEELRDVARQINNIIRPFHQRVQEKDDLTKKDGLVEGLLQGVARSGKKSPQGLFPKPPNVQHSKLASRDDIDFDGVENVTPEETREFEQSHGLMNRGLRGTLFRHFLKRPGTTEASANGNKHESLESNVRREYCGPIDPDEYFGENLEC